MRAYLGDFKRLLDDGGLVFLTAFEEDVPNVEVNPPGYIFPSWEGELLCVRYNRTFFEGLARDAGFTMTLDHNTETHGQSAVWLNRT